MRRHHGYLGAMGHVGPDSRGVLELLRDSSREISVAADSESDDLVGFVIVLMQGAFVGHIRTVAVAAQCRGPLKESRNSGPSSLQPT